MIDPVEYLVRRKFPNYKALQFPPSLGGGGMSQDEREQRIIEIEAYEGELKKLPVKELKKLVEAERAKEVAASTAKANREEQSRFFNAPHSRADFSHWAKATYWTLEEAIALSFGKSPEVVNWKRLEQYKGVSPFVAEYAKVRDLAIRAENWRQLYDPVQPGAFLAWAKRNDFSCPEELGGLVTRYGQNTGDWKTAYDNLKTKYDALQTQIDELTEKAKQIAVEKVERTSALVEERDALLEKITELRAAGKPLYPKERESVLKLIIGMAIEGYGYDRSISRSPTTKEIADDLSKVGLQISEDTVRKWLKEAVGLLPSDTNLD